MLWHGIQSLLKLITTTNDLKPGIYLYSLIAGGQEMETRRMIISK